MSYLGSTPYCGCGWVRGKFVLQLTDGSLCGGIADAESGCASGQDFVIEGVKQVTRDRAQSSLSKDKEEKLLNAYLQPEYHPDIARLVDLAEIQANKHNLSIPLYVSGANGKERHYNVGDAVQAWQDSRELLQEQTESLFKALKEIGY